MKKMIFWNISKVESVYNKDDVNFKVFRVVDSESDVTFAQFCFFSIFAIINIAKFVKNHNLEFEYKFQGFWGPWFRIWCQNCKLFLILSIFAINAFCKIDKNSKSAIWIWISRFLRSLIYNLLAYFQNVSFLPFLP